MGNILVTGGAGYIGAHIVDLLIENYDNVIVYDNLSTGYRENLNSKTTFIEGDILNNKALEKVFEEYQFDSIIHMAAFKAVGESMNKTAKYTTNNIIGSLNLISTAIKFKIKKFIFSSTAAVYGNPIVTPLDESHQLNPINHYGYTKLYIENYLKWISKIEPIKFISFRYFNVAGYSTKQDLINKKERVPENLLPIVMEVANNTRKDFNIFGNDYDTKDGTCIRDYIHVLDLAEAHIRAIDYLDTGDSSTINLSTGIGYSVLDIVKITEQTIGNKITFNYKGRREGDPPILISTFNKANKLLRWNPKYSIEDIVSSMWKIYK